MIIYLKNKFLTLFLIINLFLINSSIGQSIVWSNRIQGSGTSNIVVSFRILIDKSDNFIVVGQFINSINGINSNGSGDVYVAKFNSTGSLQWIKTFGGTGVDNPYGLTFNHDTTKVIVSGFYSSNISFSDISRTITNNGTDVFFVTLDISNGQVTDAQKLIFDNGNRTQQLWDMKMDTNGDLIIAGTFIDSAVFYPNTKIEQSGSNIFIAKIGDDGTYKNHVAFSASANGGTLNLFTYGLAVTNTGYYLTGYFRYGTIDFGSVAGTVSNPTSSDDIYLVKTSTAFNGSWVRTMRSTGAGTKRAYSIGADLANDQVIVGGQYNSPNIYSESLSGNSDTLNNASSGTYDIFISKYNSLGEVQWLRSYGSTGNDVLWRGTYGKGAFFSTGSFSGTLIVQDKSITSKGNSDIFGIAYDGNDFPRYLFNIGGTDADNGRAAAIDSKGRYIIAGDFKNTASPLVVGDSSYSGTVGRVDFIIAKYDNKSISGSVVKPTCPGKYNGAINVTMEGTANITNYEWTKTDTTPNKKWFTKDLANIGAGAYTLVATDDVGESTSKSFTVVADTALDITSVQSDPSCYQGHDGQISISHTPLSRTISSYSWSSANGSGIVANQQTQNALTRGTYKIIATDNNGCTDSIVNLVLSDPSRIAMSVAITPAPDAVTNGNIDLSVSGGTPKVPNIYTYDWRKASDNTQVATTQDLAALSAQYNITVTDSLGCTADSSFTITNSQVTNLVISEQHQNITCSGNTNGSITVTTSGDRPNRTYTWYKDGILYPASDSAISNLGAGTYKVVVNGTLQKDSLTVTLSSPTVMTASGQGVNIVCYGQSNGQASASVTGGTSPYTYSWNNGSNSQSLVNLVAGTYIATVTDAKGCQDTAAVVISQPAQIGATLTPSNITCFGRKDGKVTVTGISGNQGTATFLWNTGATSQSIQLLFAGTYNLTISDPKGCSRSFSATVAEPPQLGMTALKQNVSCNGLGDGSITLTPSGGNNIYQYSINNGVNWQNSNVFSGLAPGAYTIKMRDSLSKTCSFDGLAAQSITEPNVVNAPGGTVNQSFCPESNATLNSIGVSGTGIKWYDAPTGGNLLNGTTSVVHGSTYYASQTSGGCESPSRTGITTTILPSPFVSASITETSGNTSNDGLICSGSSATFTATGASSYTWNSGESTPSIVKNSTGEYIVTGTDDLGCTNQDTLSLTVFNLPTASISISDTTGLLPNDGSICAGSSAVLTASGGISYLWGTGESTALIVKEEADNYTVTVTDANGCKNNASATIVKYNLPNVVVLSNDADNTICPGDTIEFTASGATTYLWSSGETIEKVNKIAEGIYTVTGTDANGCQKSVSRSLTLFTKPQVSISSNDPDNRICTGQSIILSATGALSYTWSTGEKLTNIIFSESGMVSVEGLDVNSCKGSNTIEIIQNPDMLIEAVITPANCKNSSTGQIGVTVSGGTSPYTYNWGISTEKDLINVKAGSYTLNVTDNRGCEQAKSFQVGEPAAIQVLENTSKQRNTKCYGSSDGIFGVAASGGSGLYKYSIDSGKTWTTDSVFTGKPKGQYFPWVSDHNNVLCYKQIENPIVIDEPKKISLSVIDKLDASCFGSADGYITLKATGGNGIYKYSKDSGITFSNVANLTNLTASNYNLVARDSNLCLSNLIQETVDQAPELTLQVSSFNNPSSSLANDGNIKVTATGGTGLKTYLLNNTISNQTGIFSNLKVGIYDLEVFDVNQCNTKISKTLSNPANNINLYSFQNVSIYPNPGDGLFNLEWKTHLTGFFEIKIYNSMGIDVYSAKHDMKENVNKLILDLTHLPIGVYSITIDGIFLKNKIVID